MGYVSEWGDDNNASRHHHRLKEIERGAGSQPFCRLVSALSRLNDRIQVQEKAEANLNVMEIRFRPASEKPATDPFRKTFSAKNKEYLP